MIKRNLFNSMIKSVFVKASLATLVIVCFAAPTTHKISQKGKAFSQVSITVNKGDSISFMNDDSVVHNVYSTSQGNSFNLKTQTPGTANSVTFNSSGMAEVRCAIHPTMRLVVNVK
ncbi:MAG TPA: plastocyanin/azurin family copper-binding protein [Blastocatellia bacterium]|nr:plastocyanin/azurin family copper-binding protein [Blastocatellia bacterium]